MTASQIITRTPASTHNYTKGRGGKRVRYVVIHVQDGTQAGSIAWFQNPNSNVSAHYLISMQGDVVQMVDEADSAWHAGNWDVNQTSIGIEHEGQPSKGPWTPTRPQLQASAELVADICKRYNLTPDAQTIISHSSINPLHRCPGPTWPWLAYLSAVQAKVMPPPGHTPGTGKQTLRLFDPATNKQVGTVSLVLGTDKCYLVPAAQP